MTELPKRPPISTLTGQPCTGHAADERCIECASDAEMSAAIPPFQEGNRG